MRSLIALVVALSMFGAACGDSGGGGDVGAVDSCDGLVAAGLDFLQDIIDEVDSMSMEEFIEASESGDEPAFVAQFEERGNELEAKQDELNCSDEELADGLVAGIDSLSADGPVGELLLEAFKSDPDLSLGD